ncbi:NAD(+)/NADH kinase [Candidatus Aerophobetes bacterium]|nr:NAD(+)/NADH kinase [Candidatus Aerophobetes bacterium]
MFKRIGIVVNQKRKDIFYHLNSLVKWLQEKRIEVLLPLSIGKEGSYRELIVDEKRMNKADLIIALGGDGTFLRAARNFSPYNIPLLGINLGGLGFLTEISISNFKSELEKIIEGKYKIRERLMLETSILREGKKIKSFLSLNDVVISKKALSRIINLKTSVSGEFVTTYAADGLIISTPTGSTAYSLSAGGPVVYPDLEVIILSPICAHTLAVRPLIIAQNDEIEVVLESSLEDVMITIDGQIGFTLKEKDKIKVSKAPYKAILVKREKKLFFKVLRNKLGWSGVTYKTS